MVKKIMQNFWRFIATGYVTPQVHPLLEKNDGAVNPYIAARHEWQLQFGDILKAKENWARLAFLTLITNIVLLAGLITVSLQSKTIPYIVKVDSLGNAVFAGSALKQSTINPLEINAFIRHYIVSSRSVIADPIVQKQNFSFVYAVSQAPAINYLNAYYRAHNPFENAKLATVEVQINSVLARSDKTWQIGWTEIARNLDGTPWGASHWEALVSVAHSVDISSHRDHSFHLMAIMDFTRCRSPISLDGDHVRASTSTLD